MCQKPKAKEEDGAKETKKRKADFSLNAHHPTAQENIGNEWVQEDSDSDGLSEPENIVQPFSNNTGLIKSGHFTPQTPSNHKCQFIFLAAPDEHVQIIFRSFHLFHWSGISKNTSALRCEELDHVAAHVLVGSRMSKIHDFCHDEIPPPLISAQNLLTLDYAVKSIGPRIAKSNDNYGFELEYRFLSNYGSQPPEAISVPNTSCSFLFNSSVRMSGDLWSPNHPGYYPRNLNCEYTFHGTASQIVIIHFEYFDVEGFGQCEESTHSDFVLFSNYKTIDRTNRRYCGTSRPPKAPIQSESNYFRMQFFANDIFDATGFYAHYQFLDQKTSQVNRVKLTSSFGMRPLTSYLSSLTLFFTFRSSVLQSSFLETVPGIAINPCASTLIFTKQNSDPKQNQSTIESFELNCGNRTLLVNTNIESPNGLAVDIFARKIYFADGRLDRIERMDEDRKNREIVLNNLFNDTLSNLFSLEFYLDRLYFTDLITNALYSVDKIAGETLIAIRTDLHDQLRAFVVVAEHTNECGIDECTQRKDELKCSNECRLNAAGSAYCVKKDVCDGQCLNGGRCHENRTTNTGFTCTCPQEYTGDRCETEKCSTFCKHGTCAVHPFTGIVMCNCDFSYTGIKCDQKVDVCAGFCRNEGVCFTASNGVHCQCLPNFYDVQCQNCMQFWGSVQKQISGICAQLDQETIDDSSVNFHCLSGSRFAGDLCERSVDCRDYRENSENCSIDSNQPSEWKCHCKEGFEGVRCEKSSRCQKKCHLGQCVVTENGTSECQCPHGFELVIDRNGKQSCTQYSAKNCDDLNRVYGTCEIQTDSYKEPSATCVCFNGWQRLVCDQAACDHYCADGSNCSIVGGFAFCNCSNNQFGPRCDKTLPRIIEKEKIDYSTHDIVLNRTPFALVILAIVVMSYLRVMKLSRYDFGEERLRKMLLRNAHGNKQFQHERMYDDKLPVDEVREFHNSAFLADDEGTLETRKLEEYNVYNETFFAG
ncbi:Suppressor of lurcher protein 1 [Aphelenchoides besseyi]|nr:Suppressor of lurcher protein 1 [Aphelenchoides besseyi]